MIIRTNESEIFTFPVIFAFPRSYSPLLNCGVGEGRSNSIFGDPPSLSYVSISMGEWNKPFPQSMQFEQNNILLPLTKMMWPWRHFFYVEPGCLQRKTTKHTEGNTQKLNSKNFTELMKFWVKRLLESLSIFI